MRQTNERFDEIKRDVHIQEQKDQRDTYLYKTKVTKIY